MAYNFNKYDFNYNKNWINAGQPQNRHFQHSEEGEAFMKGVFVFIAVGILFCIFH